ncbi:Low density lipoprotein receptor adapter protein 1 [Desmophyllum pertusum]|uniref:Low density lipoprotein receptor adapter protein 1 n=1 Tax=Desmophyllum pertusum TaxID=174260 RepID=A0A9W9YRN1_9CNID|nr:Low density lipoprotein receptor adapter protein 1 [Desmophyllum pertusum]
MDSLKLMVAKVKNSPQVIRKAFSQSPYAKEIEGKYQEDWLHSEEPLKEGIQFYAKLLGSCPVFQAQGSGCTDDSVQQIIANTKKEKIMEIPIYRVSCCATDPNFTKVFAFISRAKYKPDLTCYALLCNNYSMAQAIALTVADAFKLAYEIHEKGKADKIQGSLRVPQNDNKENTQHAKPVLNNGNIDTSANSAATAAHVDTPIIQITAEPSSSAAVENLIALDLAVEYDDFDAEFTKLAESRSNPILFETPVRRRDFSGDVNHLVATEATAKELMMSKSTEDLFSM